MRTGAGEPGNPEAGALAPATDPDDAPDRHDLPRLVAAALAASPTQLKRVLACLVDLGTLIRTERGYELAPGVDHDEDEDTPSAPGAYDKAGAPPQRLEA